MMPNDRAMHDGGVVKLISRMFTAEEMGGGFEEKLVELDDNEVIMVNAWLAAKEAADTLLPEGSIVDRAFIGAVLMLHAIHMDSGVASAVAHYCPLTVWKKLTANFLLSASKGSKSLLIRRALRRATPRIRSEVIMLSSEAAKHFLLDVALLATEVVAKAKGAWWDNRLAPVVSAVIISEFCREYPLIWEVARKVSAADLFADAIRNLIGILRERTRVEG